MPGLLQMLTILAQTLGPLYQVTRGKHRIDNHILKKKIGNYLITSHLSVETLTLCYKSISGLNCETACPD